MVEKNKTQEKTDETRDLKGILDHLRDIIGEVDGPHDLGYVTALSDVRGMLEELYDAE